MILRGSIVALESRLPLVIGGLFLIGVGLIGGLEVGLLTGFIVGAFVGLDLGNLVGFETGAAHRQYNPRCSLWPYLPESGATILASHPGAAAWYQNSA